MDKDWSGIRECTHEPGKAAVGTRDWRAGALQSLNEARAELEAATEDSFVMIFVISERDLAAERPVSIFANIKRSAVHRMVSFFAWRTSMWPEAAKADEP
jgi:hypothetical protein